ncbi:YlxR family protein [Saccharibacillus sp. CPCC 101409]|uniref:RNase P modulator RnpM n=1 Tax=Saccharibacillus sp. CPCC 101409 TaxID=3058041 RepID=UPI002671598E|nr:YlxR family protein [Saccharibacillus sp. CPCC 101409]MDO3410658.1 YlxR family protein [Saccharibacillus sp. CPCC 101409]
MKKKKIPLRKCVASQEMLPKKELIRVVRTPDGEVQIDLTGKKSGRGAYLRADAECFKLAQKNKALDRALKQPVPAEIYEQLARDFIRVEQQFREIQERETDDE